MKFSTTLLTLLAALSLLVFAGCNTKQPVGTDGDTAATANLEVVDGEEAGVNSKAVLDVTDGEETGDEAKTLLEVTGNGEGGADSTANLEVVAEEGDAPARNPEAGDTDTE